MGATPAKFFPGPTPYGTSPDMGVLAQAKAASPAPPTNFLPLNPPDPSQQPQQSQSPQSPQNSLQGVFQRGALGGPIRYGGGPVRYNGNAQFSPNFYA